MVLINDDLHQSSEELGRYLRAANIFILRLLRFFAAISTAELRIICCATMILLSAGCQTTHRSDLSDSSNSVTTPQDAAATDAVYALWWAAYLGGPFLAH
jgi:hypothetical protein